MLISVNDLKTIYSDYDFSKFTDERIRRKLEAIEQLVIEYTNNHFYNSDTYYRYYQDDREAVNKD